MIRILLALAVAAAAYFGPWVSSQGVDINGKYYAGGTAECAIDLNISIEGECAPVGGLQGKFVTATVALGVVAAVLGIVGLIPFVGRITSLVTIVAGIIAMITFAYFAKDTFMGDANMAFTDFRWGAYATGVFGLLTLFAGLAGLRGEA
ncbi:MAG: hypothetical protein AAF723_10585 [Pseudomonadota bacterium]